MPKTLFAAIALLCLLSSAEARQNHPSCTETGTAMQPVCGTASPAAGNDFLAGVRQIRVNMRRDHGTHARRGPGAEYGASQVVAHPSGCPGRAFCACGASVRVFGRSIRSLWLAASWFRFPRAAPAAGMVAVRRHHVFVLEEHISGDTWQVFDANSGGRKTRIHARSIAGYAIVNPHGAG